MRASFLPEIYLSIYLYLPKVIFSVQLFTVYTIRLYQTKIVAVNAFTAAIRPLAIFIDLWRFGGGRNPMQRAPVKGS